MLRTDHPLLDSLGAFWLPVHGRQGGSRMYDVFAGEHGNLIDGVSSGGTDWAIDPDMPFPAVDFQHDDSSINGADDGPHVRVSPKPDFLSNASEISILYGISVDATADPNDGDSFEGHVASFDDFDNSIGFFDSGSEVLFTVENSGTKDRPKFSSSDLTLNTHHVVAGTFDSGESKIYLDGQLKDTRTGGPSTTPSTTADLTFGWYRSDFENGKRWVDGRIGYVLISIKEWSDSQVKALSNQARRGFPDVLRRRSDVGLLGGGGGPTADTVSPGTGTALAEGFDPTITATANTVSPGTAQAAAQGFSATVTATQNTVSAGTAQATAQGFAPTITADPNTIAATIGQAPAQGFDPTISEGAAGDTLVADLGTAQAQGFAPSISTNPATVTLGLGQATANGFTPDVVTGSSEINTGQGQAAATGFDPTVTTDARTVAPQLGTAQAEGFEPAVVDGTVGVATTMEIEARPLYEIDVEARPLYRIRLFVKEQLP